MPTPVSPNAFKSLIPRINTPICGRFLPSILGFFSRFLSYYEYVYSSDGTFTQDYKNDICQLCSQPGTTDCPSSINVISVIGMAGKIKIEFAVAGKLPFTYVIYRSTTSDTGPWGTPIYTGTAVTSGLVAYEDTTVVETERYYYKIDVSAANCNTVSRVISEGHAPSPCYYNTARLLLQADTSELNYCILNLYALSGLNFSGTERFTIYRRSKTDNASIVIASNLAPSSGRYFQYRDNTGGQTGNYIYTIQIHYSDSCPPVEMSVEASPSTNELDAPPVLEHDVVRQSVVIRGYPGLAGYLVIYQSLCGGGFNYEVPKIGEVIRNVAKVDTVPANAQSGNAALYYNSMLQYNCRCRSYTPVYMPPLRALPGLCLKDSEAYNVAVQYASSLPAAGGATTTPAPPLCVGYRLIVIGYYSGMTKFTRPATITLGNI